MAITEQIIITVDNSDAQAKIGETQRKIGDLSRRGKIDFDKLGTTMAKTFLGFNLAVQVATRLVSSLTQSIRQAFIESLGAKAPEAIKKMEFAWKDLNRTLADRVLGDTAGDIDRLADAATRASTSVGDIAGAIINMTPAVLLLKANIAALEAIIPAGGPSAKAIAAGVTTPSMLAAPSTSEQRRIDEDARKAREEAFRKRSERLVGGRSMEELLAGRQPDTQIDLDQGEAQARMEAYQEWRIGAEERLRERLAEIDRDSNADLTAAQALDLAERESNFKQYASVFVSSTTDMMAKVIDGQKVSGKEWISTIVKQMGQMLFSKGLMDFTMGLATAANIFTGGPAVGGPMMTTGLKEMALGTAAMASGRMIGGAGGGGGGGGGGSFAGGGAGGGGGGGAREENRTVIINVSGAAISDAGVGVQITKAIDAAKRQGLL